MKQNRSLREWGKRLLLLLLGLIIAHLGVTLFLLSSLGADTFTIFIQGLSRTFGMTVGTWHVIVLCIIMVLMLIFAKGYVKPGTVVCAFCGGPIIDFFTYFLRNVIHGDSPMYLRVIAVVLGCLILSAGMSLVIKSDAGTGPNDLVAVVLTDKIGKFQFRWVRMCCDACFTILGVLLGGTLGLGTVVAILLTGPVVQKCMPYSERFVGKIVESK